MACSAWPVVAGTDASGCPEPGDVAKPRHVGACATAAGAVLGAFAGAHDAHACTCACTHAVALLTMLLQLFRCHDKGLRELLHNSIVADIRGMNAVSRNEKVRACARAPTCATAPCSLAACR